MKSVKFYTSLVIGAVILLGVMWVWIANPHDDTDSENERSGLEVHTDAMTGVQYLSTSSGGLVVRINPDGKPITKKTEK